MPEHAGNRAVFPISPLKLMADLHREAKVITPKSKLVTTLANQQSPPKINIQDSTLVVNVNINLDSVSSKAFVEAGMMTAGLMAAGTLTTLMMGFWKNRANYNHNKIKLPPLPKIKLPKI